MTGTTMTSAALDARRKRLLFRAWHRGMREMDLVLGTFADRELPSLNEAELAELEAILDMDDRLLAKWVTGEMAVPDYVASPLFSRIRAYRP